MKFVIGKKCKLPNDAPSVLGFQWFFERLHTNPGYSDQIEVRHAGRCGYCGRHLTTPASIDTGFGPDCAALLGVVHTVGGGAFGQDNDLVERFIIGGNAYLTLTSKRTGVSFTYRIRKAKDNDSMFFVSVLTGPDNWANYDYIGQIYTKETVSKPVERPSIQRTESTMAPVFEDIMDRFIPIKEEV